MNLPGRVLVTGGGSGIGEAIALRLAAQGSAVLIVGRDAAKLQAVAARAPQRISTLIADLTVDSDRRRVVDQAKAWDGIGIDALVNNAGVSQHGFFEDLDAETVTAILSSNLLAPLLLTQALLPHLQSRPRAHLVNLGSAFGFIGYPSQTVYSASKFGIRGFTEALRRELAGSSVHVHHIAPRATRTPMNAGATDRLNAELGNRVDAPERVADAVLQAMAQGRSESVIGWPERFFTRLNGVFPSLVDGALIKQLPVIRRFTQGDLRS
jgi:short-subunit dehydrogenase